MRIDRIKFDGAQELDAQLARIGKAVATEIAEAAVRGAADGLAEMWRLAAPYDPAYKIKSWSLSGGGVTRRHYGHLRENIKVFPIKSVKVTWIGYRVTTGDAFWGYFQEFGTVHMRARPWARPTLDWFKPAMKNIQIEIFNMGIADAAAGRFRPAARASRKFGSMLPNGRNA